MQNLRNSHKKIIPGLAVEVNTSHERGFERALRQFNKKVQESGLLKEAKDRMYYVPASERRKNAKKMAKKRWQKKLETENTRYPL